MLEILIPIPEFQRFDYEQEINVLVSADCGLKAGDTVAWECAQFDGDAKVVSCYQSQLEGKMNCVLKKL